MPRARFQFSLRLAFLLMTLACVSASWIGWKLYKRELDAKAAALGPAPEDPYADERLFRDLHPEPFKNAPPLPPPPVRPPDNDP